MLADPGQRDQGFRQLFGQYGPRLYWHIRRLVVDHDDAQDVLQETAIKVLQNIGSFKRDSLLSTWIYRIAINEALMHLRRQTRLFQSIDSLSPELTERLAQQPDLSGDQLAVIFQQSLLQLDTIRHLLLTMKQSTRL